MLNQILKSFHRYLIGQNRTPDLERLIGIYNDLCAFAREQDICHRCGKQGGEYSRTLDECAHCTNPDLDEPTINEILSFTHGDNRMNRETDDYGTPLDENDEWK